jgi:Rieske 2Fe-2S family protein
MGDQPWFDREDYPLREAEAGVWEGFLFLRLTPSGPPLAHALGPLSGRFDAWRLRELVTVRRAEYAVRANWKLLFQNFSECYHCPPVHPALARLSHYRSGANDLREGPLLGGYMTLNDPSGSLSMSGRMCGPPLGALPAEDRARVYYYSVFPGLFLTVQPDFVMSTRIRPLEIDRTEIVCEWHFAPETARTPGFDPSDGVALWDATNRQDWHVCELAQQGVSSRAYMRLLDAGEPARGVRPGVPEEPGGVGPGALNPSLSRHRERERPARGCYKLSSLTMASATLRIAAATPGEPATMLPRSR